MANEFFRHFGPDAAVTLSPRGQGILEVFADGERIYDRAAEGGEYPTLPRVHAMVRHVRAKIGETEPGYSTPGGPRVEAPAPEPASADD